MTTPNILIRDETKDDAAVISAVTAAAFENLDHSHTEQFTLRAARPPGVERVTGAEVTRVVGQLRFAYHHFRRTPAGYGLGYGIVRRAYQQTAIGKALIPEGAVGLKALGARGCDLVGHRSITQSLAS
jgi:putative acetyltransferase